jgi:hypothetical protein
MKKESSIALCLLCAFASFADAQSDSARTASPRHRAASVAAWGTVGLGTASFAGARASTFPPTLLEAWLTMDATRYVAFDGCMAGECFVRYVQDTGFHELVAF